MTCVLRGGIFLVSTHATFELLTKSREPEHIGETTYLYFLDTEKCNHTNI